MDEVPLRVGTITFDPFLKTVFVDRKFMETCGWVLWGAAMRLLSMFRTMAHTSSQLQDSKLIWCKITRRPKVWSRDVLERQGVFRGWHTYICRPPQYAHKSAKEAHHLHSDGFLTNMINGITADLEAEFTATFHTDRSDDLDYLYSFEKAVPWMNFVTSQVI